MLSFFGVLPICVIGALFDLHGELSDLVVSAAFQLSSADFTQDVCGDR